MFGFKALLSLLLAGSAMAHVRMTAISVNGGAFVSNSVRLPPSNSPVTDVTSVSLSSSFRSLKLSDQTLLTERHCELLTDRV